MFDSSMENLRLEQELNVFVVERKEDGGEKKEYTDDEMDT